MSFPRDLWVDIPGMGSARSTPRSTTGPQKVIDTLKADFGVDDQPLPRGRLQDVRGHRERDRQRARLRSRRRRATSYTGLGPSRTAPAATSSTAPPRCMRTCASRSSTSRSLTTRTGSGGRQLEPRPTSTASSASRTSSRSSGGSRCERTLDDPLIAPDIADELLPNLNADTAFDRARSTSSSGVHGARLGRRRRACSSRPCRGTTPATPRRAVGPAREAARGRRGARPAAGRGAVAARPPTTDRRRRPRQRRRRVRPVDVRVQVLNGSGVDGAAGRRPGARRTAAS